jgi:serine/threonine protein phosphatase 1
MKQFEELLELTKYNPDKDELILLGDYVDRGFRSKDVVSKIIHMKQEYGIVALKGNHDQMMVDAFRNQEDGLWLNNGGFATITSYYGSDIFEGGFEWEEYMNSKRFIIKHHGDHIDFLENLPLYHENEEFIFVHAGINPLYLNWKNQPESEFYWVREIFYNNPTNEIRTVIFGHTPTVNLHGKPDIWFGEDKIGIDGACAYGKQLNCLEISDEGYKTYNVLK